MTPRNVSMILNNAKKEAAVSKVDEGIIDACGHNYILGKIREFMREDMDVYAYNNIVVLCVHGINKCYTDTAKWKKKTELKSDTKKNSVRRDV